MEKIDHETDTQTIELQNEIEILKRRLLLASGDPLSIENLTKEENIYNYIGLLKAFSFRYSVIILAYDTPTGPGFTVELSDKLRDLGLKVNLRDKFRMGYIAILDSGSCTFEHIETNIYRTVKCTGNIGKCELELESSGWHTNCARSHIVINSKPLTGLSIGLNFVVFDKVTGAIVDFVTFDTYSEGLYSNRNDDSELKDYFALKGVSVVMIKEPVFPETGLTESEQFITSHNLMMQMIFEYPEMKNVGLNRYYDNKTLKEVLRIPSSYYDINGVRRFSDCCSKYINISGGHRITLYQPDRYQNTIYLVGGCKVFGTGSDDSMTISSQLQKCLTESGSPLPYIVQNYGFFLCQGDSKKNEIPSIIKSLPLKKGDIIILFSSKTDPDYYCIDLSNAAVENRNVETFADFNHFTPDGNKLIAEKIYEGLISQGVLNGSSAPVEKNKSYGFTFSQNKELAEYQKILSEYYNEKFPDPVIGSIVMNCNPFTLGHRYLIEMALEQCDFLIIFVVQEDKSIFPFEDRLRLVDECTADIVNKEVIPSGKFIISSLTFSEYFNKSEMQDRTIDPSLDVTVFAREIAPCLHITKRFAGEEPNDSVTRQYNETMKRVLPEYGIGFVEIPRAEMDGKVISASDVRALLEKRDFDTIGKIVPDIVYNYLWEKFADKE